MRHLKHIRIVVRRWITGQRFEHKKASEISLQLSTAWFINHGTGFANRLCTFYTYTRSLRRMGVVKTDRLPTAEQIFIAIIERIRRKEKHTASKRKETKNKSTNGRTNFEHSTMIMEISLARVCARLMRSIFSSPGRKVRVVMTRRARLIRLLQSGGFMAESTDGDRTVMRLM